MLYGVQHSPMSTADFFDMMNRLIHRFEPHPINEEFLAIIQSGRAAPGTPKYLSRAMGRASVSLLPRIVRDKLGLGPKYDLSAIDRVAVKALGRFLERTPIPGSPPCDASLRVCRQAQADGTHGGVARSRAWYEAACRHDTGATSRMMC